MKKEKKQNKKKKIIKLIIWVILLIMLVIFAYVGKYVYITYFNRNTNNDIIATTENVKEKNIKYKIYFNEFDIEKVIKTIKLKTNNQAKSEYHNYQSLNEVEKEGMKLELKNKKLIVTMQKEQFFEEVNYKPDEQTIITETGEEKKYVDQFKLIKYLQSQGYTIK